MKKLLFLCLILPAFIFSAPPTKEAMLQDFEILKNTYAVRYAPGDWKKQYCDWEMERAAQESVKSINNLKKPTVKAYQHIVSLFLQSMRDVHVRGIFYSTEASMLPFTLRTVDNRFFITAVHSKFEELFPGVLNVGDELLSFDSVPAARCLEEIMKWKGYNPDSPTDRSLATRFLTFATASQDLKVKEGPVTLTLRKADSGMIEDIEMEWLYQPERIFNGITTEPKAENQGSLFRIDMSHPFYGDELQLQNQLVKKKFQQLDDNLQVIGARKSFVPVLGDLLWESEQDTFFYAYLFETENQHKVGYIRIPSFSPESLKENSVKVKEVEEFAKLISYLEEHSETLIIDVVDNPGGAALFMYTLASMLTDTPLVPPKFRQTITQQHIIGALSEVDELEEIHDDADARDVLGDTLQGYPVDYRLAQSLLKHCRFLIDEWNSGKRITNYDYLLGMSTLAPYPYVHYTKPIIVLTNELSISCGDFFPAILQDNKRALIFGAKTAGAGGGVQMFTHPNHFGIAGYSCTSSIAERVNREPIENLGVTPDISYDVTVEDMQGGYKQYAEAVKKLLQDVIG